MRCIFVQMSVFVVIFGVMFSYEAIVLNIEFIDKVSLKLELKSESVEANKTHFLIENDECEQNCI